MFDFRCSKTSAEDFSMLQQPQTKKNGSAVSVAHGRRRCAAALGRFGRLLAGRRRCRGTTSGVAAKGFMAGEKMGRFGISDGFGDFGVDFWMISEVIICDV